MIAIASLGVAAASTITIDANGEQDVNNLKQIALAIHNYLSVNGRFPPEYLGPTGTPLLSWRVALLPYLDDQALYNQFDFSKAWDDPANIGLLSQMPAVFRTPLEAAGDTDTSYVSGVDPNSIFPGSPGVTLLSITDGTSNTLLVGESVGSAIPWTAPEDITLGACPILGGSGFSSNTNGAVPFAFADGSVKFLPDNIDCATLRGLFIRNDGFTDTSKALDYVVGSVPEPASLSLSGLAVCVLAITRFRHRRSIPGSTM